MVDQASQISASDSLFLQRVSRLLGIGLLLLTLGVFLGDALIAAGQVCVVVAVVLNLTQQKEAWLQLRRLPASAWWLIAFAVFAVISVVANWDEIDRPLSYLKKTRYDLIYVSILLVPTALWKALSPARNRDGLMLGWLIPFIPAFIVGLIGILRLDHPFADLIPSKAERLSGLHGEVMTFAYTLQFSVIALSVFFFTPALWKAITRVPWKWVIVFAILVGVAMYLTYSRGAMLGVVVGLTVFAMMRSRYLMLGLLAVGLIGGIVAFSQGARYLNFEEPVRGNQWRAATVAFIENPMFGLGFRNFEIQSVELKKRYGIEAEIIENVDGVEIISYVKGHAHNNFLEAFASIGVFGGLCFIGFCSAWFREVWRSRYRELFIPLLVAFIVSGLFENTFYDSEVLNCILLIYFFSQVAIVWEKKQGPEQKSSEATPLEA